MTTADELMRAEGLTPEAVHQEADIAPTDTSWEPVDLGPALDGTRTPAVPVIGRRDDHVCMFYPAKTHSIVAESEAGKSWLALITVITELRDGHPSMFIDFEDDEQIHVDRLKVLGADAEDIRKNFIYVRPETPITKLKLAALTDTALSRGARSVWLDGITEAMTLHGFDPLKNQDIALFNSKLTMPLASAGLAVISLDHVVKSLDGRGRYGLGGVHKLNAVTGAQYVLENREPFGIDRTGRSTIRIAKDRPGQLRRHGLPARDNLVWFGDLVIDSHGTEFAEASIEIPHEAADRAALRPTELMTRCSTYIQENPGLTKNAVISAIGGKRIYAALALELLVSEGYVHIETKGQRQLHHSVTAFPGGSDGH